MPNVTDPVSRSLVEVMEDERYSRLKDASYDELFELALIGHRCLHGLSESEGKSPSMSIAEFCEQGYLQEVNRQVLHSSGLAMYVYVEDDGPFVGSQYIGGVYDERRDPEGYFFAPVVLDADKARRVKREQQGHQAVREQSDIEVDDSGIQVIPEGGN